MPPRVNEHAETDREERGDGEDGHTEHPAQDHARGVGSHRQQQHGERQRHGQALEQARAREHAPGQGKTMDHDEGRCRQQQHLRDAADPWRKAPFVLLLAALLLFGCFPRLLTDKIQPDARDRVLNGAPAAAATVTSIRN